MRNPSHRFDRSDRGEEKEQGRLARMRRGCPCSGRHETHPRLLETEFDFIRRRNGGAGRRWSVEFVSFPLLPSSTQWRDGTVGSKGWKEHCPWSRRGQGGQRIPRGRVKVWGPVQRAAQHFEKKYRPGDRTGRDSSFSRRKREKRRKKKKKKHGRRREGEDACCSSG